MNRWIRAAKTPSPYVQTKTQTQTRQKAARGAPAAAASVAATVPDLYARWAMASNWRGFNRGLEGAQRGTPQCGVRIIARAANPAAWDALLAEADKPVGHARISIATMYRKPIPGSSASGPASHFTALLAAADLPWLAQEFPGINWELAVPLRAADPLAQGEASGRFGPEREACVFRAAPVLTDPPPGLADAPNTLLGSAIAIIDFGCPFLNSRFSQDDKEDKNYQGTRIAALWDQNDGGDRDLLPWWRRPGEAGYGRELGSAAINNIYRQVHDLANADAPAEATVYSSIDYLISYNDPRRRVWFATHGAHVLDMAGGSRDPLAPLRPGGAPPLRRGASDDAGRAPLVFVQLPALTAADSSGGSLGAQLLDAVRYAMAQCKPAAPLVINISYGTFAGPHDGRSMIERALDELLQQRAANFAIVLGAGNARRAGCHVRRTVAKNRSALLRFVLDEHDTTDTFVEVWYPRPDKGSPNLHLRVRTAGRDWSEWVAQGHSTKLVDPATGEAAALLQHEHHVPGSDTKALALLALAPTAHAQDDDGPLAEPGVWEIEIGLCPTEGQPDGAAVDIDAYVERDDPGEGGGGAQPRFIGIDRDDERDTLSSIATGQLTIAAGAYRVSDSSAAEYSSLGQLLDTTAGPTGSKTASTTAGRPLVYAAAEEDAVQPNIAAAAVRSTDVHRMNGTSVAAPVLARQLYNWLLTSHTVQRSFKADGTLIEDGWIAVLQALARKPGGFVREPPP